MAVRIEKAGTEDAALLTELRLLMRAERETVPPPADMEDFRKKTEDFFREEIASGRFCSFIAYAEDKAAAVSGMCMENHPPSYGNLSGRTGYVVNMFTLKEYRGRGLAKLLLDALKEEAEKNGCRALRLNASSMGKPVYEKYGFTDVANEMILPL